MSMELPEEFPSDILFYLVLELVFSFSIEKFIKVFFNFIKLFEKFIHRIVLSHNRVLQIVVQKCDF